jgi:hypothetical protein
MRTVPPADAALACLTIHTVISRLANSFHQATFIRRFMQSRPTIYYPHSYHLQALFCKLVSAPQQPNPASIYRQLLLKHSFMSAMLILM